MSDDIRDIKVIEDIQLKEIQEITERQKAGQDRVVQINESLFNAYQKAGTLVLTKEESDALMAPFPDPIVAQRPHDKLLYIPHIVISDRLCKVFGPGQWTTIRRREWVDGNRVYAEWVMIVRGHFVGESVGAMDYYPNNAKMNYSDALEGTRGECIRRIAAKELGCGSQVWYPDYAEKWLKAKNGFKDDAWHAPETHQDAQEGQDIPPAEPKARKETQEEHMVFLYRDLLDKAMAMHNGVPKDAEEYVLKKTEFPDKDGKIIRATFKQLQTKPKWLEKVHSKVLADYQRWMTNEEEPKATEELPF